MHLIIGLGNIGDKYQLTRHNVGFMVIDQITKNLTTSSINKSNFQSTLLKSGYNLFSKPTTYMNNSGEAVGSIMDYYKIDIEDIIVIHDDLDLPFGTVKYKIGGGHGGHNGLRDTIKALDTNNFYRLRIGIGHPGTKDDVVDFVLSSPGISELKHIESSMNNAIEVVDSLANGDFEDAMLRLHTE